MFCTIGSTGENDAGYGGAEADIVGPLQRRLAGNELVGQNQRHGDGEPDHRPVHNQLRTNSRPTPAMLPKRLQP